MSPPSEKGRTDACDSAHANMQGKSLLRLGSPDAAGEQEGTRMSELWDR